MALQLSVGLLFGIIVGLVIAFVLLKMANTNHRMKTEYDERQQLIRGKGYMYGFYTILFYEVIMMILDLAEVNFPIEHYTIHFVGVIFGCTVLCIYCLWNDVYWGLNNNKKKYSVIIVVCIILNLLPIIGQAANGTLVQDGKIGLTTLNIFVIIMMAAIGVAAVIKKLVKRDSSEEE
ncbi:hypothetical protein D6855_14845 [Butyrivibrio sp. CB08]|uniref:hypothetical protein n=1 Tax=Butyrivibrio sp. CB08 TaxID=2364879 RepID=UPI000EA89501|nr:hypothetical protein [Butyrivibrio sp. CB08]RKM56136.1 hypothetical protein D6855_14845 [Butyrivibrio sp. CB08]